MAKTTSRRPDVIPPDDDRPLAEIDAAEFEAARQDPRVRAFAERAREYWSEHRPEPADES